MEEEELNLDEILNPENSDTETLVLKDNNLVSIKNQAEFLTNKDPDNSTNRICTSLFKRDRLAFLLQYSIAYVKDRKGLQKHVMRYPQIFATKAIQKENQERGRNKRKNNMRILAGSANCS